MAVARFYIRSCGLQWEADQFKAVFGECFESCPRLFPRFFSLVSLLHLFSVCMRLTTRTDKSGGDRNKTKNEIRKTISQFFRERDCVTLVRPTVNEKELRHIDKVIFFLFCFYFLLSFSFLLTF